MNELPEPQGSGHELRIFGPPGTGKTTTLARQIARAAERYGADKVLVASYSRTAAQELVSRELPIPAQHVGTLHALCYRALGRPVLAETRHDEWNERNPDHRLTVEKSKTMDEAPSEGGGRAGEETPDDLNAAYHLYRARRTPRARWLNTVIDFATRYEAWKAERDYADFTDLIEWGLKELPNPPGGCTVGFYDEAQDFSLLEAQLIQQWGSQQQYYIMVGDDDQLLYSWRGASAEPLLREFDPHYDRVLAQSYRVPRAVHACAEEWIARVSQRQPKAYAPRDAEGAVTYLTRATWRNVEPLVAALEDRLDAGGSVMLLSSCGYLLTPVLAALKRRGVPYHNPYRRTRGDWNPLTPAKGLSTRERVLAYLRPDNALWGGQARLWTLTDLAQWTPLIKAEGNLRRGARTALEKAQGAAELTYDELHAYFTEAALDHVWDNDLDWLIQQATPEKARSLQYALAIAGRNGAASLKEEPRLTVGTIHSVKGGEADHVFLLPDLSPAGREAWAAGGESRDSVVRQFYVGITRARETLTLCGSRSAGAVVIG